MFEWTQRSIDKRLFTKCVLAHIHWQMTLNMTLPELPELQMIHIPSVEITSNTPATSHPKYKKR